MVSGQSMRSGRVITATKVCGVKAVKQKMRYEGKGERIYLCYSTNVRTASGRCVNRGKLGDVVELVDLVMFLPAPWK